MADLSLDKLFAMVKGYKRKSTNQFCDWCENEADHVAWLQTRYIMACDAHFGELEKLVLKINYDNTKV